MLLLVVALIVSELLGYTVNVFAPELTTMTTAPISQGGSITPELDGVVLTAL